jgi:hypothetical protein
MSTYLAANLSFYSEFGAFHILNRNREVVRHTESDTKASGDDTSTMVAAGAWIYTYEYVQMKKCR